MFLELVKFWCYSGMIINVYTNDWKYFIIYLVFFLVTIYIQEKERLETKSKCADN